MSEIEFGPELAMLAKTTQDVLRKQCDLQAVRSEMRGAEGFASALFRQLSDLGLCGVAVPESYGGAGMGAGSLVPVAEAMGRSLYAGPWLSTTLATQLLLRLGDGALCKAFVPGLCRGELRATVAWAEPDGSFMPTHIAAQASDAGGGYRLNGVKCGVLDAASADLILVSARLQETTGQTPPGPAKVFLIERKQLDDSALQRETLVDETRRSYRVMLRDVEAVPVGGVADAALRYVVQLGALLMAAEMSGGLQASMELTLDYLSTRTQFGKLIGGYQALKHPMVDILVAAEQGRSLLYHAATVFDGESTQSEVAVRMAKAHCGTAFTHAADRGIQFHGAIGFTYECHAQLFFRRAQWAEYQFGDALHHRNQLQRVLLDPSYRWGDGDSLTGGGPL